MSNQLFNIPKRPPSYINNQPKQLTSPSPQSNSPLNIFPKAQPLQVSSSLDNNRLIPNSASNVSKTIELSFSQVAPANKSIITLATPLKVQDVKTQNPIVLPQTNKITNQSNLGHFPQSGNQGFNGQTGRVFQNAPQTFPNNIQNNQQMCGNGTQNTTFFNQNNNQIGVNLGTLGILANQPFINNNNTNYVQNQPQPDTYNTNVQLNQSPPEYQQNPQYPQSPYYHYYPNNPQDAHCLPNPQDNSMQFLLMYPQQESERTEQYNQTIAYLDQQVTGYQDLFKALAILTLSDSYNQWDLKYFHPNQLLNLIQKFAIMVNLQNKRRREIEEYRNSIAGIAETNRIGYFRFDEQSFEDYYDEYIQSALETFLIDQGEICKIIQTNPSLMKQIIDNRSNINKYISRKIIINMEEFSPKFEPAKRQRNKVSKTAEDDQEFHTGDNRRACSGENATFGQEWVIEVEEIDQEQTFRELMARY